MNKRLYRVLRSTALSPHGVTTLTLNLQSIALLRGSTCHDTCHRCPSHASTTGVDGWRQKVQTSATMLLRCSATGELRHRGSASAFRTTAARKRSSTTILPLLQPSWRSKTGRPVHTAGNIMLCYSVSLSLSSTTRDEPCCFDEFWRNKCASAAIAGYSITVTPSHFAHVFYSAEVRCGGFWSTAGCKIHRTS